jgi:hypothetical protein
LQQSRNCDNIFVILMFNQEAPMFNRMLSGSLALCSVAYVSAADDQQYKVRGVELFENENHTYSITTNPALMLNHTDKFRITTSLKMLRHYMLQVHLGSKQAVVRDSQIGDCDVHLFCAELATGNRTAIETDNIAADFQKKLQAKTHELVADVVRKEGGGDGVYYPTGSFSPIGAKLVNWTQE